MEDKLLGTNWLKFNLWAACATVALATASVYTSDALAAEKGAGSGKQAHGEQGHGSSQMGGEHGSGASSSKGKGLGGIFHDITGVDEPSGSKPDTGGQTSDAVTTADDGDESDRPEWAGQPGGKDGVGGGRPATSGSKKGDLFGDLWVILRDENGVPILSPEGFVQPLDIEGNLIALDEEGHPVDETLTVEVELGRLNVGRAPSKVLDRRADEVIALLNDATDLTTDAAGRLVLTVDGVQKTIDSPLENLAIYVALLTQGSIPGVDDLPGTEFDFMVDGVFTAEDLAASTSFLAAATDKSGEFSSDEIAYIDAFLGINMEMVGDVSYSAVDYSTFTYDRSDTYGDVTVVVLVEQPDGSYLPTSLNVYDEIFGSVDASAAGSLDAYTLAADDARIVINFVHEYAVPSL
jgi:hypothetical protein